MSLVMRTASRVLLGLPYRDTQCGFKLFPRSIAHDLFSQQRSTGWTFDAEVLFIARRRGYRVVETPVVIHQRAHTSISFLRDTPGMLRDLLLIRWNAMRGRYA